MRYLKQARPMDPTIDAETERVVRTALTELEELGESGVRQRNEQFDKYVGRVQLSESALRAATASLPQSVRDDLRFARDRVRDFARQQRESLREFEVELQPGLVAGQRLIPITTAGCYVPGGRYAHAASAIMSICTARVAGVSNVIAATPAQGAEGAHPALLYAMQISGATHILLAGGIQGIAALAFGVCTGQPADIIVGPGNRFVAEAKRQLFGRVGIDVVAGPTENLIIADETADPRVTAMDLAGQAEHGSDSPVWLVTTSEAIGRKVLELVPRTIAELPDAARRSAGEAWRDFGEVVVVDDREEACRVSDDYAPEHLQVQAADLDWWLERLRNYGSLFLGEETTVAFGDKCSGPNHILPTRRAARYSGGLSVHKFIKTVSYQRMTREATATLAPIAARISRLEGMEGHARTGDVRLQKYFPERQVALEGERIDWFAKDPS